MDSKKDIFSVILSRRAKKSIKKLPEYIVLKLQAWVDDIATQGLSEVRKRPGYHDEPLKGKRNDERSIRLSKAYRAIYIIKDSEIVEFIEIVEVNKHDYR